MLKYAKIGFTVVVMALLPVGAYLLFKTEPVSLTVVSFSWERSLDVEVEKTVEEKGGYVPAGGREKRRYEDCSPTIDSEGNMGIDCDTVYIYDIERWFYRYTLTASNINRSPHWPNLKLAPHERLTNPRKKYTVHLKNSDKIGFAYICEEKEWLSYQPNEPVIGRLGRFGIRKLIKLEKEK